MSHSDAVANKYEEPLSKEITALNASGTGNLLYYVTDHLGSVRTIKDGAGTVRQRFDYYPYGSVSRVYTNSGTTDNSVKRFRFGGKEIAGSALTDLAGMGAAPGAPYLDFGARLYSPQAASWLSTDPMAEKYYGIGPYVYCAGSPVNLVDPEGDDWYVFTDMGVFSTKIEHSGKHRLVLSSLDEEGNQTFDFFDFADAVNDPKAIDNGIITNVLVVGEQDLHGFLESQGTFDSNLNCMDFVRASNSKSIDSFHNYDYSASVLAGYYGGTTYNNSPEIVSHYLFIPQGDRMAHNLMNFGNYLWGATGYTMGIPTAVLLIGAHLNSLGVFTKPNQARDYNGYRPQFDSIDDQRSIAAGASHARNNAYRQNRK